MGKASREKGKRGEREACDVLRPIFPEVRRRAMQARSGASDGADLENTGRYHVEVGVGKSISAHAKWSQAYEDSALLHTSIALTRKDRGPWLVTMEAGAWVELVRKATAGTPEGWCETHNEPAPVGGFAR